MRLRRTLGLGLATLISAASLATASPGGEAHAEPSSIHITQSANAVSARVKGKKGAVAPAQVECGPDGDLPDHYKIQVTKGSKTVASGTNPDRGYRVKAGRYKVTTTVECGAERKVFTKKVRVKTLKDKETVSGAEYKKIRKGMSRKKAEKIVGGKFKWCVEDQCEMYSTKWDYIVQVDFDKGKVVYKGQYYEPYFD